MYQGPAIKVATAQIERKLIYVAAYSFVSLFVWGIDKGQFQIYNSANL